MLYATIYKFLLAEIYLEMLTSRARPPFAIVRNLGMIFRVKFSGVRRTEALLEQASRAPHLHECGSTRARINMDIGLLRKLQKKPDLARQFLEKARAPAKVHGATLLVTKINPLLSPRCTRAFHFLTEAYPALAK